MPLPNFQIFRQEPLPISQGVPSPGLFSAYIKSTLLFYLTYSLNNLLSLQVDLLKIKIGEIEKQYAALKDKVI